MFIIFVLFELWPKSVDRNEQDGNMYILPEFTAGIITENRWQEKEREMTRNFRDQSLFMTGVGAEEMETVG